MRERGNHGGPVCLRSSSEFSLGCLMKFTDASRLCSARGHVRAVCITVHTGPKHRIPVVNCKAFFWGFSANWISVKGGRNRNYMASPSVARNRWTKKAAESEKSFRTFMCGGKQQL